MTESRSKAVDDHEDELDQLASAIRAELRQAGFRPAFDPLPEELSAARRHAARRTSRRRLVGRMLLAYAAPALIVILVGIAVRLFGPGL